VDPSYILLLLPTYLEYIIRAICPSVSYRGLPGGPGVYQMTSPMSTSVKLSYLLGKTIFKQETKTNKIGGVKISGTFV